MKRSPLINEIETLPYRALDQRFNTGKPKGSMPEKTDASAN